MLLLLAFTAAPPLPAEVGIGLGYRGGVYATRVVDFETKLQAAHEARLTLRYTLVSDSALVGGVLYRFVNPSDVGGGYAYRGFAGVGFFLGFEWVVASPEQQPLPLPIHGGAAFTSGFAYAQYLETEVLFFHPDFAASVFAEYRPPSAPGLALRVEGVGSVFGRRDVEFFAGGGLGLEALYRFAFQPLGETP